MYIHKNALGLGLMRLNTILTSLHLKLYFGHTRLQGECNRLIDVNFEELQVECGQNCDFSEIPDSQKTWNRTWIDHVFHQCQKRNINVERCTNFLADITTNLTVIDYAVRYTKSNVVLGRINQVRRFKKILLPLELVGTTGRHRTMCATI